MIWNFLTMPGCVLHINGEDFEVDAFLAGSSLRPFRVCHRGENNWRKEPFTKSSLSLNVSDNDGDLAKEAADATRFLSMHEVELQRLRDYPGVSDMRLDFGYYHRGHVAQFDYLPPDLLLLAGKLRIGIELSLYIARQDESSSP